MPDSISQSLAQRAALPLSASQESVARETVQAAPAPVHGLGAAQGTRVAVGDGVARQGLHQDTQGARDAMGLTLDDDDDDGEDIFYDFREDAGEALARPQGKPAAAVVVSTDLTQQRDTDAAQVQQEASWGGMFSALTNAGKAALGLTLKVVDVVLQLPVPRQAADASATAMATNPRAQRVKTARQINLSEAAALATRIEMEFDKLNENIRRAGGVPVLPPDPDRPEGPQLGSWDTLFRFKHAAYGNVAATQTTLKAGAAGAALPAAASAVAPLLGPVGGMALQVAGTAAGGAQILGALLEYPELARDHQVVGMIEAKLEELKPDLAKLSERLADERTRIDVERRAIMVGGTREQKIMALKDEILQMSQALVVARARKNVPVAGDGGVRAHTLTLAGRARSAFTSFFASMRDRVSHFFGSFSLPFTARSAAMKKEAAYVLSKQRTLDALREPTSSSITNGLTPQLRDRIDAAGATLKRPTQQLVLGENLTRALRKEQQPNFGLLNYRSESAPEAIHRIGATLTAARAMAWYLDTIADLPPHPGMPEVKRNADNSLSVSDPERKLASFLMSVPVAYTARMAGSQAGAVGAGLRIDDPSAQLPGGMAGLQFESVLDETGQSNVLRLSFAPRSADPVYQPLGNERQGLLALKHSLERASAPAAQGLQDYSEWSVEALQQGIAQRVDQQDREYALFQQDQRQLKAIDTWQNPKIGG